MEAVAKENSYKYVLDTSAGNVLYSESSEDILMLVKKKLDSMPAAVIPGANPEKPKTNPGPTKGGK
ncbi:MAG: OmpH family outer membrane protein [Sphingobacteriaceae bacterium]|nr:OmpH family outer membrane protein [Sphingobacteriaceae bacterium]